MLSQHFSHYFWLYIHIFVVVAVLSVRSLCLGLSLSFQSYLWPVDKRNICIYSIESRHFWSSVFIFFVVDVVFVLVVVFVWCARRAPLTLTVLCFCFFSLYFTLCVLNHSASFVIPFYSFVKFLCHSVYRKLEKSVWPIKNNNRESKPKQKAKTKPKTSTKTQTPVDFMPYICI